MVSTALVARGTTISVATGGSPEYVQIVNVSSISGPGSTAAEIEITDLSSTAKEYLLDLVDNGTVSLSIFYNPNDTYHAQLRSDNADSTARTYRITMNASPQVTATFSARVQGFTPDHSVANAHQVSVELRVTGTVTYA